MDNEQKNTNGQPDKPVKGNEQASATPCEADLCDSIDRKEGINAADFKDTETDDTNKPGEYEKTVDEEQDPLTLLEEDLKAQKDKYLRLMAEFDNYKRRSIKEYERIIESANQQLVKEIIEVYESLGRALKMDHKEGDLAPVVEGMKLIFSKLDEILKKNGLSVFGKQGEEFDPLIHDALMKTPHEEIPEDHIVDIYEQGYRLNNTVIKHARVIVSSGPQETVER